MDSRQCFFFAFDHRATLARMFGNHPYAVFADLKLMALDSLSVAATSMPTSSGRVGLLVDEELGSVAATGTSGTEILLAMPIDRSGTARLTVDHGDQLIRHLDAYEVDYAKVLVRLNPEDSVDYHQQMSTLAKAMERLQGAGYATMLEVIVPPTSAQFSACDQDQEVFDRKLRGGLVSEVITDCYGAGLRPELWKLEGLESSEDYVRIGGLIAERDSDSRALVLGRGAPDEQLERWLSLASGAPSFAGFAIGRTIWGPSLGAYRRGELARDAAVQQMSERYLHFVDVCARERKTA